MGGGVGFEFARKECVMDGFINIKDMSNNDVRGEYGFMKLGK
jgi:hypothetical protein